ncbi:MAG: DegT/DnrJ/EryC1/StrS aminotransferase family protein [Chloroflexi bacterium]|nr:DegT/DnrJ/EryC1/StrS aminotransferase family protein [Chloroflexota bacterium]OJV91455.1 MAG: UDP-4-amino-4,6-dideoxy-N-acetyl-beta-L-altrosamine transaminase [Chloroflexi bacterium 54-19]
MRSEFLPFFKPLLSDAEINEVVETLRSGWLTTGPRTKRFEEEFADFVGAKYAIAVNSATAALHLGLDAVGVKAGDEVLVPTYTFAATAEVVNYFGAVPVLVDCEPGQFNLDLGQLERLITPRTKAIIPVDIAGEAPDMDVLLEIAARHNLKVVEDAAHAIPAKYKGRWVGTLSDLTAFSFYANKNITTGEGGMLTTDNEEYADRARIMSLHGISKDAWKRYTSTGSWYYEILQPGFKYNMTDVAAALGLHQLQRCFEMQQRREAIVEQYDAAFEEMPEVEIPPRSAYNQSAWHLYLLRLNLDTLKIDRNEFLDKLKAANIGFSVHYIPLHMHPYYREKFDYRPDSFPVAALNYRRVVTLPLYPAMSNQDVRDVIEAVQAIVDENRA